jgi:hypothetical protein
MQSIKNPSNQLDEWFYLLKWCHSPSVTGLAFRTGLAHIFSLVSFFDFLQVGSFLYLNYKLRLAVFLRICLPMVFSRGMELQLKLWHVLPIWANEMYISDLNHLNLQNGFHRNVLNVEIHNSVQAKFWLCSRYKSNIQYEPHCSIVTVCVTWCRRKWMRHTLPFPSIWLFLPHVDFHWASGVSPSCNLGRKGEWQM